PSGQRELRLSSRTFSYVWSFLTPVPMSFEAPNSTIRYVLAAFAFEYSRSRRPSELDVVGAPPRTVLVDRIISLSKKSDRPRKNAILPLLHPSGSSAPCHAQFSVRPTSSSS